MKQDRVELVLRDRVHEGESRKAFRRRMKPIVVGMRRDARMRSRASQRAGGAAERCIVRSEAVHDWRAPRASKRTWRRKVRRSAVTAGRVGAVEWMTTPGGAMPSLNGYLVLPNGHPWLRTFDEDDFDYGGGEEYAPREYTYRRGAWIGVDSAHGNDAWDSAELRAKVKPFPKHWSHLLSYMPEWLLPDLWNDSHTIRWTVDAWTQGVEIWARAADEAGRG